VVSHCWRELRSTWISTVARSQDSGPAKVSESAGGGTSVMSRVLNSSFLADRVASTASTSASHDAISFFVALDGRGGRIGLELDNERAESWATGICIYRSRWLALAAGVDDDGGGRQGAIGAPETQHVAHIMVGRILCPAPSVSLLADGSPQPSLHAPHGGSDEAKGTVGGAPTAPIVDAGGAEASCCGRSTPSGPGITPTTLLTRSRLHCVRARGPIWVDPMLDELNASLVVSWPTGASMRRPSPPTAASLEAQATLADTRSPSRMVQLNFADGEELGAWG
jgi:hypothetical protein